MTWPVRSKLLGRSTTTLAADTVRTLGTVPAGKTWLVKDVRVYNAGASSVTVTFGSVIGGVFGNFAQVKNVPAGQADGSNALQLVLPAGADLYFTQSVGQVLHVHVSGAQLG